MDNTVIEFLINSNPVSATAVLCVIVLFFYRIIRNHEKNSKKMLDERINTNNRNIDDVNNTLNQIEIISNNISENVKAINTQINVIQEKIRHIETSDVDNKLELLYLKKDIESIKKCIEFQYLRSIAVRDEFNDI